MEVYSTEQEQTNALRHFFTSNGKALAAGLVIGIAALGGWRYWMSHQESNALESSARYQQLSEAMNADKPETLEAVAAFVNQTQGSYGALAAMDLAKIYADTGHPDKAAVQLQQGIKDSDDANLQAVMRLRLARLQLQQNQADDALKTLDSIKGDSWTALSADIRGEALLSKGDKAGARAAWSKGIDSDASPALKQMMQMKLNNLS
ncbi:MULTISPECIES: YfgM family protein [Tatumella]|uniref:Ancillary SecYEG translocon subunit n=1 Tax=Tatumella punctata TaxID=399969 RepID=A0ABW1VSR0_9GAMM|nr:YfgM family protein [Tatumella sp. JGM16]MBS0878234.1 YfgM family protein [Tatumella sp. JGM82]MBS0891678.1 YfgM family protein [Tatumella sp. JGM94]MBS0893886.1 YfgM family protein [Tatumella sp. JGM130]MBS0902904.1 YfgM family protein [Tatumella sp. JGM100]MBS0913721.1 YfgM family protein [Tatumella sp. JGM91]